MLNWGTGFEGGGGKQGDENQGILLEIASVTSLISYSK